MIADEWMTLHLLLECPDLPAPYIGYYERWTNCRTGDVHTCLNLFGVLSTGRTVFLRCFHASTTVACWDECADWFGTEVGGEVIA